MPSAGAWRPKACSSKRIDSIRVAHRLLGGRARRQNLAPIAEGAVEHVAVDRLLDARHVARGGELPEQPRPVAVDLLRRGGDGAEPEIVAWQLAFQHLAVK